jgi:spore maturation protein CgeB
MSWNVDPRLKAVYRPPVEGKAKSAAMRVASIALNNVHYSELGGVNKRTFELGAMGAFQLVDAPAVGDYFEPGVECATFRGPKDLVDQVRRWLPLPAERAAIARRGLVRAFREHSYNHRLNEMFERIPALRGEPKLPVPVGPPEPDGELELTGGPCKKRLTVAEVSLPG